MKWSCLRLTLRFDQREREGRKWPSAFLSRTGGNRCCLPASTSSCFIGNRLPRLIHARATGLHTRRCCCCCRCRWLHPPLARAPSLFRSLLLHARRSFFTTAPALAPREQRRRPHRNWPKRTNCKTLELQHQLGPVSIMRLRLYRHLFHLIPQRVAQ